jgi:hypothetical protein
MIPSFNIKQIIATANKQLHQELQATGSVIVEVSYDGCLLPPDVQLSQLCADGTSCSLTAHCKGLPAGDEDDLLVL